MFGGVDGVKVEGLQVSLVTSVLSDFVFQTNSLHSEQSDDDAVDFDLRWWF